MKKILAVLVVMILVMAPAFAQAKVINITKADFRLTLGMGIQQQKGLMINKMISKALGYFLPSPAWAAASCVATNTCAGTVLGSLVAASTAGLNGGKLILASAADATLATLTLNATVGTIATNVLTFNAIADGTATGGAPTNCTKAFIQNAAGTTFFTANVGTADTTVIMSAVAITTGDTIHVTTVPTITLDLGT